MNRQGKKVSIIRILTFWYHESPGEICPVDKPRVINYYITAWLAILHHSTGDHEITIKICYVGKMSMTNFRYINILACKAVSLELG